MGVSKSLNRLALFGLLACGAAWAQDTVTVQVGLSTPGPIFLIDGQPFSSPQIVQWSVGSTHQVYFLQSKEADGSLGNHQYPSTPGIRYTFGGWTLTGQTLLGDQGPLLSITVSSTLTQILGQVTTEVAVYVYFSGFTDPTLPCSSNAINNDPRAGVILVGSSCFSAPATIWWFPDRLASWPHPFPDSSLPTG